MKIFRLYQVNARGEKKYIDTLVADSYHFYGPTYEFFLHTGWRKGNRERTGSYASKRDDRILVQEVTGESKIS